MSALPKPMNAGEIARIMSDHATSEVRVLSEHLEMRNVSVSHTSVCYECLQPATMFIMCAKARFRAPRCDAHGLPLIVSFHNAGFDVEVDRYRSGNDRESARDFLDRLQRGGAKPARMDEDEPDQDTLNRYGDAALDFPRPYGVLRAESQNEDPGERCPVCEAIVAYDDFDHKKKTCKQCERLRMIESGEARAEMMWARGT
jgi:hypothetical protein